jgi:hypothetical protein
MSDWAHKYYTVYYLYKMIHKKCGEDEFLPRISNYSFKVVTTVDQLDELMAEGYDFALDAASISDMRRKIEKGCVGFLIFVDKELGNRCLIAMTEEAMFTFNRRPYKVNFANHEVCGTDNWTNPKYRNLGLATYRSYKMQTYLLENGITTSWGIIETNNKASIRQHMKASSVEDKEPYAKVWYFRIFGKEFWKETPLNKTGSSV